MCSSGLEGILCVLVVFPHSSIPRVITNPARPYRIRIWMGLNFQLVYMPRERLRRRLERLGFG